MLRFTLLLCLISITSHAAVSRPDDDNLTQKFAQFRATQVKAVDYNLHFNFAKGREDFDGHAVITAQLKRTDAPLSVDFLWKEIRTLKVNGKELKNYVSRKGSFDIPAKLLTSSLTIEVDYVGAFDKEGQGIQRAVDPEDKSEYVFTDFEPSYAHGLFPCFDQPDLKATFSLSVTAPKDWTVIGNYPVAEAKTHQDITDSRFEPTKRLSTYLFFVGAGPFKEWKDTSGPTPIYLYARQSLAKYVDEDNIFSTLQKGLSFFNDYFSMPYPFPKYAQVYIPEFAWGGMENPGAVAVNEKNIYRGPVTQSRREDRDDLMLHEMAHMWFGDLVTMEWWNDLWLNESFATYVASIAQERLMHAKGSAQSFFSEKTWGYWQDLLPTTHPIETTVSDVRSAKGNFDGITYAKGSAALQQLHFFVGEAGFRQGLQNYFKKYAFQNTTRKDFINAIADASKKDLSDWTKKWLQTAGPNHIEPVWSCADGKIKSFVLQQSPSVSHTLSPHRTSVATFRAEKDQPFALLNRYDVTYTKAQTLVNDLVGKPCPDFVYANEGDNDYGVFLLDKASLNHAKDALAGKAEDSLLRMMLWHTLEQMVRDQKLRVSDYFTITLPALEQESDDALLGILLGRHSSFFHQYRSYLTADQRIDIAPALEAILWKRIISSERGSNLQMSFFDFYNRIAQTKESLERLFEMVNINAPPAGITLDQDRRWSIINTLAEAGDSRAVALIDKEEKRDPTTEGKRNAFAARAAIPNLENKQKLWELVADPSGKTASEIPRSHLEAAADQFHNPNVPELSEAFTNMYFKKLTSIDWKKNDSYTELFFENLFPGNICSPALLKQSAAQMHAAKLLTPLARRAWTEANDELDHCVKIRALDRKVHKVEGPGAYL